MALTRCLALKTMQHKAISIRLALQRFAQRGHSFPNCKQGHYQSGGIITGDVGKHEVSLGWFLPNLHEIMAVPFNS